MAAYSVSWTFFFKIFLVWTCFFAFSNGFLPTHNQLTTATRQSQRGILKASSNPDGDESSSSSSSSPLSSDELFLQSLNSRTQELDQKNQELRSKWKTGDCKSSIPLVFPDWIRRLDVNYPLVACGSSSERVYVGHLETGQICFHSHYESSGEESDADDNDDDDASLISDSVIQQTTRQMFGNYDGGGTLSIVFEGSLICEGGRGGGVRVWRIDPDSKQLVSQGTIPALEGLLATCMRMDPSGDELWVGTHTGQVHLYRLDDPLKPLALKTKPDQIWHLGGFNGHSSVLSLQLSPEFNCGVAALAGGSVKLFSTNSENEQEATVGLYPPFDSTERRSANIYPSQAAFVQTRDRSRGSTGTCGLSIVCGGSDGSMYIQPIATLNEYEIDSTNPFQDPMISMGQGHAGGGLIKDMLSPEVNRLVTLGQDGCMRIWDIANRAPLYHFAGYKVWAGSMWSDGRRLVSDGVDNTILMHDFAESEDDFSCGN